MSSIPSSQQNPSSDAALALEAMAFRGDHSILPESGIADVARALRRHVDPQAFERALAKLPPGAREFWAV